ncbi:hypothetical protein NZK27_01130 [Synechococcus sp. FGCU-3]|nr:hypothetical protein [Synechococcus sp. FGCU3]
MAGADASSLRIVVCLVRERRHSPAVVMGAAAGDLMPGKGRDP